MTPWDEVLLRHEHERGMIMRWEERIEGADETETLHQFEGASASGQSDYSRATSRATSPGFYNDE